MFTKLTNLSYQRTKVQALGFYLAWLITSLIFIGVIGAVIGTLIGAIPSEGTVSIGFAAGYEFGKKIGAFVSIILSTAFAIGICYTKGRLTQFSSILLIVITAAVGFLGGLLFGLIIPAYLTTRASIK